MLAQDVADVLAEEAFDALAEFLDPLDVLLCDPPSAIGSIGDAGLEWANFLLGSVVKRNVGDEVLDKRESLHRLDLHRLIEIDVAAPRHAHQPRLAVDLGRARAAFPRLTVPAAGEIG